MNPERHSSTSLRRAVNRYFAGSLFLALVLLIAQGAARADEVCLYSDTSNAGCQALAITDPFPVGGAAQSSSFSLATADGQFTAVGTFSASSSALGGLASPSAISASLDLTLTVIDLTGNAGVAYVNDRDPLGLDFTLPFILNVGVFVPATISLVGTCQGASGSFVHAVSELDGFATTQIIAGQCPNFAQSESGGVAPLPFPFETPSADVNFDLGAAFNFAAGPAGQSISLPLSGDAFAPSPVPEPSSLVLFGTGMLGLLGLARILRRRLVW